MFQHVNSDIENRFHCVKLMAIIVTSNVFLFILTLIPLTWTRWRAPTNVSKWRMGFNSAFKGLKRKFHNPTAGRQNR